MSRKQTQTVYSMEKQSIDLRPQQLAQCWPRKKMLNVYILSEYMPSHRSIVIVKNKRRKRDFLAPQKIMLPRYIN